MKQSVERLEKTLARVAKEQGLAQERLRRWVSFVWRQLFFLLNDN